MSKHNIENDLIDNSTNNSYNSLEDELEMIFKFPDLCTYSNIKDTDVKLVSEIIYYCLSTEEQKKEYAQIIETVTRKYIDCLSKENQDEVYKKFNDIISSDIKEYYLTLKYIPLHMYVNFNYHNKLIDKKIENEWVQSFETYNGCEYYSKYKGQNKNALMHGNGKLQWYTQTDDILIWTYIGLFNEYKREGQGSLVFKNGISYVGEFHQNSMHGKGIMIFKNGNIFEGIWENNMFSEGTLKTQSDVYTGKWKYNYVREKLSYCCCFNKTTSINKYFIDLIFIKNNIEHIVEYNIFSQIVNKKLAITNYNYINKYFNDIKRH